jgi:hypothetical protein
MSTRKIEGNLTVNGGSCRFCGTMTIQRVRNILEWDIKIENPSPDIRRAAYEGSHVTIESCDGRGKGELVMIGNVEVHIRGGHWTDKQN